MNQPVRYDRPRRRKRPGYRPYLIIAASVSALLAIALIVILIIQFGASKQYTYKRLLKDARALSEQYEDCRFSVLGQSVLGQDIPMLSIGDENAENRILIVGATHAREHITARLAIGQATDLLKNPGDVYLNRSLSEWTRGVRIDIVPVLNPDGMRLCTEGLGWVKNSEYKSLLKEISGGDFLRWKANGRGVDLNSNYDAEWDKISKAKSPAAADYKGEYPVSEPENAALIRLIEDNDYDALLTYHTRGEVIFWYFGQEGTDCDRDLAFAAAVAAETGYHLVSKEESLESRGGLKDWFVLTYQNPGLTIEMGAAGEEYPFSEEEYLNTWRKCRFIPYAALHALQNGE